MLDVLVTTAGGVEEDLIKVLAPTYLGEFELKGETLRKQGLNRIGNLLVPNDNYCKFEDWLMPILDAMKKEQDEDGTQWTPSKVSRVTPKLGGFNRQSARLAYLSWKIEIARDWYRSQNGRDLGAKVKMCTPVHGLSGFSAIDQT
jgi:deoxyhypusine synthase